VDQCEEAYRITTTKGLAAAFAQRAFWLQVSMWIWVSVLIVALGIGYWLGSDRLKTLAEVVSQSQHSALIWFNGILALFSFGGPIWLAWIATKQIGQCFRLKEDYAFKASVAKAYEGYRKEAARIDSNLEERLFSSALTRLEEAPLRLVEEKTHGSPWHEFLDSSAFQQALKTVPGFRQEFETSLGKTVKSAAAEGEPSTTNARSSSA